MLATQGVLVARQAALVHNAQHVTDCDTAYTAQRLGTYVDLQKNTSAGVTLFCDECNDSYRLMLTTTKRECRQMLAGHCFMALLAIAVGLVAVYYMLVQHSGDAAAILFFLAAFIFFLTGVSIWSAARWPSHQLEKISSEPERAQHTADFR